MDNLLMTTVEFFLIPEASLSVVFLVIFIIIFGVGVYWERKCRAALNELAENGERDFEAVREKMSPDLFIKKYLRKFSAAEGTLEELPNVFVSVGIVATFLGLGVAIQGAAELLQTDKLELARLTAVLGVIAFKFQTSVWGICCSLIFRRLFVERYFEFRQEVVDELYDRLYSLERDSIRTLIERQNEFMSAHLAWQRTFEEEKVSSRNVQHAAVIAATNDLAEQIFELENNLHEDNRAAFERLDYLATNFNRFVKTAEDFAANELIFAKAAEDFSARVDAFKAELTEFLHKEFADIKAVNEEFSRIQTEHIEKISSEHELNILHVTQQLEELHRKFYLDGKRFVEETQQALDKILSETIGNVHEEYSREAYEIRRAVTDLNGVLSFLQNSVENINNEFTDEQKKFVDSWQIVFDRISETMQKISAATTENADRLENAHRTLLDSAEAIRAANDETAGKLAELVEGNSTAFTASMRVVTAAQTNTAETVRDFTAAFNETADKNFAEFTAAAENLRDAIAAAQENILKSSTGNVKALINRQEQILAALNRLIEKIPVASAPSPPAPQKVDSVRKPAEPVSALGRFFSRQEKK